MAFTIDKVVLRTVRIPLNEPFRISNGSVSEKESVIVELHSVDGSTKNRTIGYGEASPMSGSFYSGETPESTWNALAQDLVPDILGRTITSPVEYAEHLESYDKESFARAGIEGAVWHLAATLRHTSIRSLLWESESLSAGAQRASAPPMLYDDIRISSGLAVGIYDTMEELLTRISEYLSRGYVRTKIKIQPGWDVEPLRAVRARFGDISLMADANGSYNFLEHADHLATLDTFGMTMLEQPLGRIELEAHGVLRRMMRTPICVDESAERVDSIAEIVRHGSASIVNIKIQRLGGLWNGLRMIRDARAAGLECWLGTMPELGIASAQSLELAKYVSSNVVGSTASMQLPGFSYATDVEESSRWFVDDIIDPRITIDRQGYIEHPNKDTTGRLDSERCAMGYRVSVARLKKYQVAVATFESQ